MNNDVHRPLTATRPLSSESERQLQQKDASLPVVAATSINFVHLRSGGVSVLLDLRSGWLPEVVHWGADIGPLDAQAAECVVASATAPTGQSTIDSVVRVALLPEHHTGWVGRPGLAGSRHGQDWSPRFAVNNVAVSRDDTAVVDSLLETGPALVVVTAHDPQALLSLDISIELTESGVLRAAAAVTNHGPDYSLEALELALPVPARAQEMLDFAGRWSRERAPQRSEFQVGVHLREGRRGRTGADSAFLLSAGEPGFGFAHGEVWGVHVATSGNHRHYAERLATGEKVLGGGELLLPGEIHLAVGETYRSPWLYGVYGSGLDDQAHRLHRYLRARPQHPRRPRPVTLNVWEAVYFDHDLDRLRDLAERAAAIGVERFVLDDGWFRGRRDDTAGLGDWYVDESLWPHGLHPLINHVTDLGMEFGLWFEPEMVNSNSDLARAHPDWILQTGGRVPVAARHQQVLDLGNPAAYAYIRDRMFDVLGTNDIAYIKWDHNRDLIDAGTGTFGRPGVHAQTRATYRLMDELKEQFPALEIESCSSGGARIDLEIIERADRVWASDCIDPLERQSINRWTQQLLPLELLGSHVGSMRSHTTGRVHQLSYRAATALFGHFGIEWDLAEATTTETADLAQWIGVYRAQRSLLHSGDVVRIDEVDPSTRINGVVSQDRSAAIFSVAFVDRSLTAPVGCFTLRGLDPGLNYRVRPVLIGMSADEPAYPQWFGAHSTAGGMSADGVVMSGRALRSAGLQLPNSLPDRAWVFTLEAISSPFSAGTTSQ